MVDHVVDRGAVRTISGRFGAGPRSPSAAIRRPGRWTGPGTPGRGNLPRSASAEARASSRRMAAIASGSCSALPQSPGVMVAIVTTQPASRSRISVPAHWNSTSSGWACRARIRIGSDMSFPRDGPAKPPSGLSARLIARPGFECFAQTEGRVKDEFEIFLKMFSRALADRCTLATKESVRDRPCATVACARATADSSTAFPRLWRRTMADMDSLTPRQREIYSFIRSKIQGRGYGPTVREIGLHFQIKSPNGVMCHLKALQKKGLIHREPNMSRAIQLLEDPVNPNHAGLKLVGRIAAGQPMEAVEQHEELTFAEWVEPGDKFALRVSGESMIDEHIADGDYVIIRKQEQARDGQIVAVRDDDGEATLKRFFRERNRIRLEPANRTMKPIFRDRVNILGILVGVVRKY